MEGYEKLAKSGKIMNLSRTFSVLPPYLFFSEFDSRDVGGGPKRSREGPGG